ncbi:hypothetical protein R6Q59_004277 [Mikania micrantha]
MPVFDRDGCIGVLEFVMTNLKEDFSHEMSEVCKALEREGLKSVIQNENINCDISKDYSSLAESSNTSSRNSKSCNVNCNDVTKCFGMTKADATKIFGLSSENTFTKVHCRYGIDVWPCVRKGVVKLSAHNALERGSGVYLTSSDETRQIEHINSLVMQDNDDINFKDDVVDKRMKELISDDGKTADGKRVIELHDEGPKPVVLGLYRPENKRSRI